MKPAWAAAVAFACSLIVCGSAEARFQMCNRTGQEARVAVGFLDGDAGWTAQGWWNVPAGGCATLVESALSGYFIYLLVDGGALPPIAGQTEGWFCTDSDGFRTRNQDYSDNQGQLSCEAAGLKTVQFHELIVHSPSATFNLDP